MRTRWSAPRRHDRLIVAVALLVLSGCSAATAGGARPGFSNLPPDSPLRDATLAEGDAWLRHHLRYGAPDSAVAMLEARGETIAPDRLIRALQEGLVLRAAGEYESSNALLEWADREAEHRRVRSVGATAGSYLVSERLRSYVPRATEAAMIPYYRMMNFVAMGDADAAAVEARRIASLLLDTGATPAHRCRVHGMLQYVSGIVFEAAGEPGDALVSYRQADASFSECPGRRAAAPASLGTDMLRLASALDFDEVADSARSWYAIEPDSASPGSGRGDVVVILERGFVAHVAESSLHVPIFDDQVEGLESGDAEGIAKAAAEISARLLANVVERAAWGESWDDHPGVRFAQAIGGAHVVRLAWPELVRAEGERPVLGLRIGDGSIEAARVGDLSEVAAADLDAERTAALGRLVTRGVTRYLVSREMEKKAEKEGGELVGFLTGRIANLASNELERADTRSWTLLPDEIHLARLDLPAGDHELTTFEASPAGNVAGELRERISVAPGRIQFVHRRLWAPLPAAEPVDGVAVGSDAEAAPHPR